MKDQLVLITWNDAVEMEGGWHELDTIKQHDLAVCKSVGWIVSQDSKQIIIMSTIEGDEYGGGVHAITSYNVHINSLQSRGIKQCIFMTLYYYQKCITCRIVNFAALQRQKDSWSS